MIRIVLFRVMVSGLDVNDSVFIRGVGSVPTAPSFRTLFDTFLLFVLIISNIQIPFCKVFSLIILQC